MATYYELLGVSSGASQSEIKQAFRRRAKEFHPDLVHDRADALQRMQQLVAAYKTLIDADERAQYDRLNAVVPDEDKFDYREFLRRRRDDPVSQSKLIFFDLLHNNEPDALALYDDLVGEGWFDLSVHLDREDFMDCAFLLAEEYEQRNELTRSYRLLMKIVALEIEKPYFRHFFAEVTGRLRSIVCTKMPGRVEPQRILRYLEELIALNLSRQDTAQYLKKAAELHLAERRAETALRYLDRGLQFDQRLGGAKRLREKIDAGLQA